MSCRLLLRLKSCSTNKPAQAVDVVPVLPPEDAKTGCTAFSPGWADGTGHQNLSGNRPLDWDRLIFESAQTTRSVHGSDRRRRHERGSEMKMRDAVCGPNAR